MIFTFLHFQHLLVLLLHLLVVFLLLLSPLLALPLKLGLPLSDLLLVIFPHGFQSVLALLGLASLGSDGGHSQLCVFLLEMVELSLEEGKAGGGLVLIGCELGSEGVDFLIPELESEF